MRNEYKILVGKPEEKRPLGKSRHRWKDNIKSYLLEIRMWVWIGFIWLTIGTRCMALRIRL
jgi:type IV secretory pathway TrbF-like protein